MGRLWSCDGASSEFNDDELEDVQSGIVGPERISRKGLEGEMLGEGDGGVEKGWGDGSMGSVSPRCWT